MVKRLGKAVSRDADIGDNVIVSAKISDGAIVAADLGSGAVVSGKICGSVIGLSHLKAYSLNASMQGLSTTLSHNLGVDPSEVVITQLSSANLATQIYRAAINQSQVTIAGNVSGCHFQTIVKA